jgi:hypothetical protein
MPQGVDFLEGYLGVTVKGRYVSPNWGPLYKTEAHARRSAASPSWVDGKYTPVPGKAVKARIVLEGDPE